MEEREEGRKSRKGRGDRDVAEKNKESSDAMSLHDTLLNHFGITKIKQRLFKSGILSCMMNYRITLK